MKRKFITFTDSELNTLADALKMYGDSTLLNQVKREISEREYRRKQYRESIRQHPKIYCC